MKTTSYNSIPRMESELEVQLTYSDSDSDDNASTEPIADSNASIADDIGRGDSSTCLLQHYLDTEQDNSIVVLEPDEGHSSCKMPVMSSLANRALYRHVAADKLTSHPLLHLLSTNGKYVLAILIGTYLLLLFFWLPLYLLSKLLTEMGVYALLISSVFYIARCILRLLAFPGTNVKVYGEIELEFARYSCRLLEGVCGALDGFGKAIRSAAGGGADVTNKGEGGLGEDWGVNNLPSAYKRVLIYRDRVLGVYWQVLHCLLKEGGSGYNPKDERKESSGFYGRDVVNACKRNLCCGNGTDAFVGDDASITLEPGNGLLGGINKYGNNPLVGDIGNMMNLTPEARSDGNELYALLTQILQDLSNVMDSASGILQKIGKAQLKGTIVSAEAVAHAEKLINRSAELRQFIYRIKPPSSSATPFSSMHEDEDVHDEESEVGADAVRRRLEENGTASSSSTMGMIQSATQSFLAMIDPPPHKYIFGLDVIRGCFLARYRGAKQFWVKRSGDGCCGGKGHIDVILVPSLNNDSDTSLEIRLPLSPRHGRDSSNVALSTCGNRKGRKAVLYCNPNAGLAEVATGLGLIGGNVDPEKEHNSADVTCWTDFYNSHGYDVYLFNYCGYGRSHASGNEAAEFKPGCIGTLRRLFYAAFLSFKPTSQTLKLDAVAVANHILEHENVNQLVIHGESIGGMAAAGAARALTPVSSSKSTSTNGNVSLLICDRTFCNLEAVAQRLVGSWTGTAIRLFTLNSWNTDVVGDFLAAKCPKIVANDAADEIIHDYSSLKSGLSFAGELTRGMTNGIGWAMSAPIEYLLADLETVSVTDSSALTFRAFQVSPPTWPADKRITWKEAFHFAACVKRIGKLATAAKKQTSTMNGVELEEDEEEGIEVPFKSDESSGQSSLRKDRRLDSAELIDLWNTLSCCDGLCGRPLGQAVKEGFDCTVSWLCCAVVMGKQSVAKAAERRIGRSSVLAGEGESDSIQAEDFDFRPSGYQRDESETMKHPIPIPVVLSYLNVCRRSKLKEVEAELTYVIGMFEYIVQRITSTDITAASTAWHSRCTDDHSAISTGRFLNLNCGHNNQFSSSEREELISLIRTACGEHV